MLHGHKMIQCTNCLRGFPATCSLFTLATSGIHYLDVHLFVQGNQKRFSCHPRFESEGELTAMPPWTNLKCLVVVAIDHVVVVCSRKKRSTHLHRALESWPTSATAVAKQVQEDKQVQRRQLKHNMAWMEAWPIMPQGGSSHAQIAKVVQKKVGVD